MSDITLYIYGQDAELVKKKMDQLEQLPNVRVYEISDINVNKHLVHYSGKVSFSKHMSNQIISTLKLKGIRNRIPSPLEYAIFEGSFPKFSEINH